MGREICHYRVLSGSERHEATRKQYGVINSKKNICSWGWGGWGMLQRKNGNCTHACTGNHLVDTGNLYWWSHSSR